MDLNKLKIGDFITMWDEDGHISVARITGFDRYKFDRPDKLNGKVCGVYAIIFPYWRESNSEDHDNYARISPYYAERADYSSEVEVMAWFQAAACYEDKLHKRIDKVHKCMLKDVVQKRIKPMDKINKYESARLPPIGCINWMWSILKDFKIWDPKKKTVKIFGKTIWNYREKE